MKILILPIVMLFVCNFSFAQSRRTIREMKIRKVEIQQHELKKDNFEQVRNAISEYDKHGNLIKEIEYNSDSTFKTFETYVFDRNNNEIEHITFDKFGKVTQKITSKYDNLDDKKEELIYNSNNELQERIEFVYDHFGQKTEENSYNKEGVLKEKIVFKYDRKGSLIERSIFDENQKLIYSRKYTYYYN
jgi:DNA-binding protein H-NS